MMMPWIFWVIATLMVVPVLVVLARPLWRKKFSADETPAIDIKARLQDEFRRDDAAGLVSGNYQDLVEELDDTEEAMDGRLKIAFEDVPKRWLAAALALIIPLAGAMIYYPHAFNYEVTTMLQERMRQSENLYDERVAKVRVELQNDPDNTDLWRALAEVHAQFGNYRLAASAYAEAETRGALTHEARLGYAEAIILSRDNAQYAKAETLVNVILNEQPRNMAALWLSGVLFNQSGDYAAAVKQWRMLLTVLPAEADQMREQLLTHIKAAEDNDGQGEVESNATDVFVDAVVRTDANIMEHTNEDDTVLIYAKAADGPPMPLAVMRIPLSTLPTTIRLDRRSAMTKEMTLDAFDRVVITARISGTGQAIPQSGEPFGVSREINPAAQEKVEIVIDRLIP